VTHQWFDEQGHRQRAIFDDRNEAVRELRRREHEVDEVKRGMRAASPADKTFDDVCDYWLANRVPQKRSGHHDESIIRCPARRPGRRGTR
jgi:hypothetical protein